jgi:hypothetical protein
VKVVGSVRAVVEQPCVVTLDPVRQTIEEPVHALFVPEGSKLARFDQGGDGEVIVDPDGPDLPETFAGDTIDVGAAAAEFAAMAIDHYPRKDGTVFAGHIESGSRYGWRRRRPTPIAFRRSEGLEALQALNRCSDGALDAGRAGDGVSIQVVRPGKRSIFGPRSAPAAPARRQPRPRSPEMDRTE